MKFNLKITTMILILCIQPVLAATPAVEHYPPSGDMELPFSEAVRVGHMLYLSGQIGVDYTTSKLVQGGIAGETRQALENIKTTLVKHGSSMAEVVKCTVFLADISEWAAMNAVYVTYFKIDPPARSAFGSSGLALGARTEIECIATVK